MSLPFPCRDCDLSFQDEKEQKRHRIQKHRHRFETGQCLLCGELTQDMFQFRDHFRESHHEQYERIMINAVERMKLTREDIKSQLWLFSSGFHTFEMDLEMNLIILSNESKMDKMGFSRYDEIKREEGEEEEDSSSSGNDSMNSGNENAENQAENYEHEISREARTRIFELQKELVQANEKIESLKREIESERRAGDAAVAATTKELQQRITNFVLLEGAKTKMEKDLTEILEKVESLQNDVETERREKDAAIPANENSQNLLEEAKMKLEKFVAETNEKASDEKIIRREKLRGNALLLNRRHGKIESLKKELDSKRSAKEAALAANEKQHQQFKLSFNLLEERKMNLEKEFAETVEKWCLLVHLLTKEVESERRAKEAAVAAKEKLQQEFMESKMMLDREMSEAKTVSFKKEIESERRATESAVAANKKLQQQVTSLHWQIQFTIDGLTERIETLQREKMSAIETLKACEEKRKNRQAALEEQIESERSGKEAAVAAKFFQDCGN